jgi:hypothetical protein
MDTNEPNKRTTWSSHWLRDSKFETLPHEGRRHGQRHPLDGSSRFSSNESYYHREDGQANLFHFAHCDPHAQSVLTHPPLCSPHRTSNAKETCCTARPKCLRSLLVYLLMTFSRAASISGLRWATRILDLAQSHVFAGRSRALARRRSVEDDLAQRVARCHDHVREGWKIGGGKTRGWNGVCVRIKQVH